MYLIVGLGNPDKKYEETRHNVGFRAMDFLIEKLTSGGYARSMIVEEPGDFCVRGGILDVFSPLYSDPLRIELFGDTIDSLRFFSAATQRKTKSTREAIILPAREAILKKERMSQMINNIREQASTLDIPVTKVRGLIDRIKHESHYFFTSNFRLLILHSL